MARTRLEFPELAVFNCQQELRIADINYGQHLGHDTLVSLLHEARCRWLATAGLTELNLDGQQQVGWVVAELVVNYLAESFYPDCLNLELAIGEQTSRGVELLHRVTRSDGKVVALARVGLVFFSYASRRAVTTPERFLQIIEAR